MKISMKQIKERAAEMMRNWRPEGESGNGVWKHFFYRNPMGCLGAVSYKNGKLVDVVHYGR